MDCVAKEYRRHQQLAVSSEDEGGRMLFCMESIIVARCCVVWTETQDHCTLERKRQWSRGDGDVPISYPIGGSWRSAKTM